MLEVKYSGELRFRKDLKIYVELADDGTCIKAVRLDEFGNEYPLGTHPDVTDLGIIDAEAYDYDIYEFLDTITETGDYRFCFDEFWYFVEVETITQDDVLIVRQLYWSSEEGGLTAYVRDIRIEDSEIIYSEEGTLLTSDEAAGRYASIYHVHYKVTSGTSDIWTYANSAEVVNGQNIIYRDTRLRQSWFIECAANPSSPATKLQRITSMNDANAIYQRSATYRAGSYVWGEWYKVPTLPKDSPGMQQVQTSFVTVLSEDYYTYHWEFDESFLAEYPTVIASIVSEELQIAEAGNLSITVYDVTSDDCYIRVFNNTSFDIDLLINAVAYEI